MTAVSSALMNIPIRFGANTHTRAEAVHQPLNEQDAEIHGRLLQASQGRSQRNSSTNNRSSPMFSSADTPRDHSGATELPSAHSRQAKKL